MTPDTALVIGQYVLAVAGGALMWSLRKAFWAGGYSADQDHRREQLATRIAALERRMDRAGEQMSEFATDLQGALERYRQVFATLEQHRDLKDRLDRREQTSDSPWPNNRRRKS